MQTSTLNWVYCKPVLESSVPGLSETFRSALKNLLEINTVPCASERYNKAGMLNETLGLMIRAGGNYASPWTRDAAVNAMNGASILEPDVAENTLWAVCEQTEDGKLCLQMDDQYWDKIVWVISAWNHYLATGHRDFLKNAYEVAATAFSFLELSNFNEQYGLFTGGSFFNDGISGYPKALHEPGNTSSFVGDHPQTAHIMTLSTNCLYRQAYRAAAQMATALGNITAANSLQAKSEMIRSAINRYLWDEKRGHYAYFLYPDGHADFSQEAAGLTFALLFDVCDSRQSEKILHNLFIANHGLPSIWPPFEGLFSQKHPGRHNNLIWPFINGFFITAAAKYHQNILVGEELMRMTKLIQNSDGEFYEIYNSDSGLPDGGWQIGRHWGSCHDQTWSATSYLRAVLYGVFGLQLHEKGISFSPCVPNDWGILRLTGLKIRGTIWDITLTGSGCSISSFLVNGFPMTGSTLLPFAENRKYSVLIELR